MAAGGAEGRHRPDRAGTAVAVVGRGGGPESALEHAQASPGDVAFGDPVGEDAALDDGFDVGAGDPRDDLDELCGGLLEHGVERVGRLVGLESFLDAGRGVEPLLKTREARLELLAGVECFGKLHQDLLS